MEVIISIDEWNFCSPSTQWKFPLDTWKHFHVWLWFHELFLQCGVYFHSISEEEVASLFHKTLAWNRLRTLSPKYRDDICLLIFVNVHVYISYMPSTVNSVFLYIRTYSSLSKLCFQTNVLYIVQTENISLYRIFFLNLRPYGNFELSQVPTPDLIILDWRRILKIWTQDCWMMSWHAASKPPPLTWATTYFWRKYCNMIFSITQSRTTEEVFLWGKGNGWEADELLNNSDKDL